MSTIEIINKRIIDTSLIYTLEGLVINPECTGFPVASGSVFWDEYHPTTLELIFSHSIIML